MRYYSLTKKLWILRWYVDDNKWCNRLTPRYQVFHILQALFPSVVVDDKVAGAVDDQEKVADFDDLRYPSGLSTFIIDFDRVAEDEVIGVRDKFDALADKKHHNHNDESSCQDDFFLFKTVSRVTIRFIWKDNYSCYQVDTLSTRDN